MPKSWASKANTLGGANALPFFCPFFGAILPHIQTSFRSSVAQMVVAKLGSGLSFSCYYINTTSFQGSVAHLHEES